MPVTYRLISSVTVGSGGAVTIEFTNIPATYDDLVVKMSTRNTATGVGDWQAFDIGFNGVLTNRTGRFVGGTGSAAISGAGAVIYGQSSTADTTASTFANGEIYIPNYAGSANKSFSIDQVTENNSASALIYPFSSLWSSTSAITSIQLASNYAGTFAQHSTATLYGIKKS